MVGCSGNPTSNYDNADYLTGKDIRPVPVDFDAGGLDSLDVGLLDSLTDFVKDYVNNKDETSAVDQKVPIDEFVSEAPTIPDLTYPETTQDYFVADSIADQVGPVPDSQAEDVFIDDSVSDTQTTQDYFVPPEDACVDQSFDVSPDIPVVDSSPDIIPQDAAPDSSVPDTGGPDVSMCIPEVASEASCDGIDNDCDGETDEGCVSGLIGSYLYISSPGLDKDALFNQLTSLLPPDYLLAEIEFGGAANPIGIKQCDYTTEASEVVPPWIEEPCDDSTYVPLELVEEVEYAGSPYPGQNEWLLLHDGQELGILQANANSVGITFGPSPGTLTASCNFLYNANQIWCEWTF